MKKENLYVDIHVLQTVPSANINRDDAGSPKTAVYGGVVRARVSSQSWKRAVRTSFREESEGASWLEGHRTRRAAYLLAEKLAEKDSSFDENSALEKAVDVLKEAGIKTAKDKKTGEMLTGALLLISSGQLEKIADYVVNNDELDKKELKKVLTGNQSLDLALFGRMVADDPELNVDASAQVAHAISTHEIVPEFDYFTALDDDSAADNAGSAMIGTVEYNSSTLYRYANVNFNELTHNLGDELAVEGAKLFIKNFVMTMPTGKQNTFANKTLPQYVMVTIRKDTPVNLVSAFEEPVKSRDGYIVPSIKKLEDEFKDTLKFVEKPVLTEVLTKKGSSLLGDTDSLGELLEKVGDVLRKEGAYESSND